MVHSVTSEILSDSIDEIDISNLGIRIRRVFVTEEDRVNEVHDKYAYLDRFAFYIADGERNDDLAQRFVEAVMLALDLSHQFGLEHVPTAIGFPESVVKKGRIIRLSDLVGSAGIGSDKYSSVFEAIGIADVELDYVWRIVPVLVQNQSLMDAASFFRESIRQVWVADDDVYDIMRDNSDVPASQVDRARIETAYQNAFKAVEAVIGEPPKDTRKLRHKLEEMGIDPDQIVGYEEYGQKPGKEQLIKKLMDMQSTRDKKAAHGKTIRPRNIGLCELRDKQALARYVILANIDFRLQSQNTV